jgi:hypothetical protein
MRSVLGSSPRLFGNRLQLDSSFFAIKILDDLAVRRSIRLEVVCAAKGKGVKTMSQARSGLLYAPRYDPYGFAPREKRTS